MKFLKMFSWFITGTVSTTSLISCGTSVNKVVENAFITSNTLIENYQKFDVITNTTKNDEDIYDYSIPPSISAVKLDSKKTLKSELFIGPVQIEKQYFNDYNNFKEYHENIPNDIASIRQIESLFRESTELISYIYEELLLSDNSSVEIIDENFTASDLNNVIGDYIKEINDVEDFESFKKHMIKFELQLSKHVKTHFTINNEDNFSFNQEIPWGAKMYSVNATYSSKTVFNQLYEILLNHVLQINFELLRLKLAAEDSGVF